MKVTAKLNNYQFGSYPYRVLSEKIIREERLDKSHHLVTWELTKSEFELLKKVVKNLTIEKE